MCLELFGLARHRLGTIHIGVIVEAMRMGETVEAVHTAWETKRAEIKLRTAGRLNKLLCAC